MAIQKERQELIDRLQTLPQRVEDAVNELSDEQLDTPYGEGKWTVRQVVHHLADSHANCNVRLKLTLTEERPTLITYDQDKWANLADVLLPIEVSLAIIYGLHHRWVVVLDSLPDESWLRTAYHPEDGESTFEDLVGIYADHGERHVRQITDLRERMGW
jgi:hypothetical protein